MRKALEQAAYQAVRSAGGTKELPAQRLVDFAEERGGEVLKGSSPSGAVPVRLDQLLPVDMRERILNSLSRFDRNMRGFLSEEAQLYGVESRTSCPVRVTRSDDTLESVSHPGLYPAGEGAGYAGGITSAACDGIRIAEKIAELIGKRVYGHSR